MESETINKVFFTADLSAGGWQIDTDLEWCLVINASGLDPVHEVCTVGSAQ